MQLYILDSLGPDDEKGCVEKDDPHVEQHQEEVKVVLRLLNFPSVWPGRQVAQTEHLHTESSHCRINMMQNTVKVMRKTLQSFLVQTFETMSIFHCVCQKGLVGL
jgi:hypothetical protein